MQYLNNTSTLVYSGETFIYLKNFPIEKKKKKLIDVRRLPITYKRLINKDQNKKMLPISL